MFIWDSKKFIDTVEAIFYLPVELKGVRSILDYNIQFINTVIFEKCEDCTKMPTLPQAAFAVRKLRESNERQLAVPKKSPASDEKRSTRYDNQVAQLPPVKYNAKLMNSIWGSYNRNSPHNFKKNNGAAHFGGEGKQQNNYYFVAADLANHSASNANNYLTYKDIHGIDHSKLEEMFQFSSV